jgi:hypothetical protein
MGQAWHALAELARVLLFHAEEAKERKSGGWAGPHHERAVKRPTNPEAVHGRQTLVSLT